MSSVSSRQEPDGKRHLWRHWVLGTGVALTFVSALAGGALLHVGVAPTRHLTALLLTRLLTGVFNGRVQVEAIESIDLGGFSGATVSVYAPSGVRVLTVSGLRGRAALLPLLGNVLTRGAALELVIAHARAEHVDAALDADSEGVPLIARAFTPRPPGEPAVATTEHQHVSVWIPQVQMGAAHVHGDLAGMRDLDIDVTAVTGSVLAGTERTSITLNRYALSATGAGLTRAQGTARTLIELPSSTGRRLSLWATFDGDLGELPVAARGGLDGDELTVFADSPRATSTTMSALLPWWPVRQAVALHGYANGVLPRLAVRGHAAVEEGQVDAAGELLFAPGGASLNLDVDASRVDLRAFDEHAPASAVSASGSVKLALRDGQPLLANIDARTAALQIGALAVPAGTVTATFDHGALAGKAHLHDANLTSDVKFGVHADPGEPVIVNLDVSARAAAMQKVAWLSEVGSGGVGVHARGEIVRGRLNGTFDAQFSNYARPGIEIARATATGALHGPVSSLSIDAKLAGQGLTVGSLYFPELTATAQGPLTQLAVSTTVEGEGAPRVVGRATLDIQAGGGKLTSLELMAERKEVKLVARAKSLALGNGGFDLQDVLIDGAGESAHASVRATEGRTSIQLSAPNLDLAAITQLFFPNLAVSGRLGLDLAAELGPQHERAHVRVSVREGNVLGWEGITATAEAAADDRQLSGGADLRMNDLGSITVAVAEATLAGSLRQARSYTRATGRLQTESTVDLAAWTRRVPSAISGLPALAGVLRARALVSREGLEHHVAHAPTATEAPPPDIDVVLWSDGLRVGHGGGAAALLDPAATPWLEGLDGQLGLHVEGETQHSQLTLRAVDREGVFAALSVLADLPLAELWNHPDNWRARLQTLDLHANLTMPRRSLALYPEALRINDVNGALELSSTMTGTLQKPRVSASLRVRDIVPAGGATQPMTLDADGSYDGAVGGVRVRASRPEGLVLDLVSRVDAPLASMLNPTEPSAWRASGSARLFSFPADSVPALADREISGRVSGNIEFADLNFAPQIRAELDLENVGVSRAAFPRGTAFLRLADNGVLASAELQQAAGSLAVSASARLKWPSSLAPAVDESYPTDFYLVAQKLRAAVLYPVLFRGIFNYFDGDLNGTLHLHQGPPLAGASEPERTVDGAFDLRDGVFQIPEVGQEFRGARAHIVVGSNGAVQVSDVSANAVTGRLSALGNLTLHGFGFANGEGEVRIARNEAVPLTFEGVPLGEAWGTLLLHAKMAGDHQVKIDVDVPTLHTDLPESSARGVQSLADHPDIVVGQRTAAGELTPVLLGAPQEKRSPDALDWQLAFYLGGDVVVRQGSRMELQLGGEPHVSLTDQARVSGAVEIAGGKVEVFGKRFELEHGSAKFEGDEPSNPYVAATARWDAPDGSRIYADFVGPLRTGLLTLRSEPARSQSEIVSVLLFGAVDAPASNAALDTQNDGTTTAGAVIAGGAVTTSVNQVLSSVSPLDITTRVTNENQTWTPEVAVQLSPRVSAEVSYRPTLPRPGENPDRVLLTLDWRFRRNWSIATTVGQHSSIMDLIWQYRY